MADFSHLVLSEVGNVTVVAFPDRNIVNNEKIERWGDELYALADVEQRSRLLLDFSNVEFLSSGALNKLVTLEKKVQRRAGAIKLCGLSPEISQIFELTRLDALFDIRRNREDALAAF